MRWFLSHVMWSVRNRLIVTYLFIGGVPIALVLILALNSAFFLDEQFSAYLAASAIDAQSQRLQSANSFSAYLLAKSGARAGVVQELSGTDETLFPGRTVQVFPVPSRPKWLGDTFHGFVIDQGHIYLRAASTIDIGHNRFTVVSSVPLDQRFVTAIANDLGVIHLHIPKNTPRVNDSASSRPTPERGDAGSWISAGSVPPPGNRWDQELEFHLGLLATDWETGGTETAGTWRTSLSSSFFLNGSTRVSTLFSRLTKLEHAPGLAGRSIGELVAIFLAILAVVFGIFVVIAWFIGIRLTRTITYSVANLYKATQHINRGDFTHRIKVREKDQLAALQTAFNSMTDSLQKLIAEQKEKERLQSELEIAHEVQAQLFPQAASGTKTLELHGICRPARIVSGDYYDFLSYGPEQVGIAVGDISGKGISAALLMATIHSAVRAYEQEQLVSAGTVTAYGTHTRMAAVAPRVARSSPAQMLWLLNRHLYASTQPEKYATLFLGFYDDAQRRLTYSNAGHLPPIILGRDGSTRRLDAGGTVVGLFHDREYEEQTVELYPGDIFIAFSDGMTEPENEFGEFGEDRLVETIAMYRHLPLERISEYAIAAVQDWIGSTEQPDDVTLVLARRVA